eukprot:4738503-Pyramimonas_sp.AAC.1
MVGFRQGVAQSHGVVLSYLVLSVYLAFGISQNSLQWSVPVLTWQLGALGFPAFWRYPALLLW